MKVLHSICQQIWKTQQHPQDGKRSVFIPVQKKVNAKEHSNYHTIALISHARKVMLKILQARLQQYENHELSDVQAGLKKSQRNQRSNGQYSLGHQKKQESYRKTSISFCCIDYAKAFDCVGHNKLWKIVKEMGIPDHLVFQVRALKVRRGDPMCY